MNSSNSGSHDSHISTSNISCGNLHRDRFELLSAYIDHEVTADERRQVEAWINEDPAFAKMHRRMTKLQLGFQQLPSPVMAEHVDLTIAKVIKKVDQSWPDWRVLTGIGGAVAAAAAIAAITLFPNTSPQLATKSSDQLQLPAPSTLMIALDQPIFVPTKGAVADDMKPAQ
jgi:anti-sigma factor RsiW